MINQMNLFGDENPHTYNEREVFVILKENADCKLRSDEAEKVGMISVVSVYKNLSEDQVIEFKDRLNNETPLESPVYYSYTDLSHLKYLMPIAYEIIINNMLKG